MQIASDTPQNKNLYKTDNALSGYSILHLSSELYFIVVKILKFPMCLRPPELRYVWEASYEG